MPVSNIRSILDIQMEKFGLIHDAHITTCAWDMLNPNQQLAYLFAYYNYFGANDDKVEEIAEGDVFSAISRDGIAGVYFDADSDDGEYAIVVPVELNMLLPNELPARLCARLKTAESSFFAAAMQKYDARKELRCYCRENDISYASGDSDSKLFIHIVLVSKDKPKANVRKKLNNAVSKWKSTYPNVTASVQFGTDMEGDIVQTDEPKPFVSQDSIKIDAGGWCKYEDSMIVNVSALSIKALYEKHRFAGLFAQNLRYYVKNAQVDSAIVESMKRSPAKFWYCNNGIIIICDDYAFSQNNLIVTLQNFSIINGGQTTKLIGESDIETDFVLQCKIVRNKYSSENEKLNFIAEVAEASNTQKPIKTKDLVANRPEQRLLKQMLQDRGVFCKIKRGETLNKIAYPKPWQRTDNVEIGKLLLAFMYQQPGSARNKVSQITGKNGALIFGKIVSPTDTYSPEMLVDLLRFRALYDEWRKLVKEKSSDRKKISLVNNGLLLMASILGLAMKYFYRRDFIQQLDGKQNDEDVAAYIGRFDINHRLFSDEGLDDRDCMFGLFDLLYSEILYGAYEEYCDATGKDGEYSNFTKTNKSHIRFVLKMYKWYFKHNSFAAEGQPMTNDVDKIAQVLFHKITVKESEANRELLQRYL